MALDGGADGFNAYRVIIPIAFDALKSGGLLVLEVGQGQAPTVTSMLVSAGFVEIATRHDLAAIERVVSGVKPIAEKG